MGSSVVNTPSAATESTSIAIREAPSDESTAEANAPSTSPLLEVDKGDKRDKGDNGNDDAPEKQSSLNAKDVDETAPAKERCVQSHEERDWQKRSTTNKPVYKTPCNGGGACLHIRPKTTYLEGCASAGSRCQPTLTLPNIQNLHGKTEKKIQRLLDAETASERNEEQNCWLSNIDYTIHHNDNGVLSLTFRTSGMGAYPDTQTTFLSVDIRTGKKLDASVFLKSKRAALVKLLERRVERAKRKVKRDFSDIDLSGLSHMTSKNLNDFIVTEQGLVFVIAFGIPHVIRVATPESEYPMTKAELQGFLDPHGALGWMK